MKKLVLIMLTLALSLHVGAQTRLTDAQQKAAVAKIEKAAAAASSMQCTFTQTKTMKMLKKGMNSKGVMYFKRPNKIRWEYSAPYNYTFLLNGNTACLKSAKSTQKIDVSKNKMFQQITKIIMNSITGQSLKSNPDFNVSLFKQGNTIYAKLDPKKKEMKQIYSSIQIYFTPALDMVDKVIMAEKTGDVTTVVLNNVKTNTAINEKVFAIN